MEHDTSDQIIFELFKDKRTYLPDDGFSDKVVRALSTRQNYTFLKIVIVVTSILLLSAIFIFYLTGIKYLVIAFQEIFTPSILFNPPSITSIVLIIFIIWGLLTLVNWFKTEISKI